MLRERPVEHRAREGPSDALAVHDERPPPLRIFRIHRGRIVWHVPLPFLLRRNPLDTRTRRVPRLAVEVRGGAVVHDAAVERPAPCPTVVVAHAGGLVLLRILA